MPHKIILFALLVAAALVAQDPTFVCPMDPEVRSVTPGKCPRCGMKLVPGIPDPIKYSLDVRAVPRNLPAGRPVTLELRVIDPKTKKPVTQFEIVHEKLFHLFTVSQDLEYFAHEHPVLGTDGWFRLETTLPKAGTYRLLGDFDPSGGTPQLAPKTISTAGFVAALAGTTAHPKADTTPQQGPNLRVSLRTEPATPISGIKTMLFVHLEPGDGIEQYIGAWSHMLAVSSDLVDTIHSHPFIADGGPDMQFNLFFPRATTYKIWLQFQRKGVVNTVAFTLPVQALQ
jgi:hypothetical protein